MKKIIIPCALMAVMLCVFNSCDSNSNGDWEPMYWVCKEMPSIDNHLNVSAESDTLHLFCSNYKPRFVEGSGNFKVCDAHGNIVNDSEWDGLHITNGWASAAIDGHNMTVIVSTNTTGKARTDTISVTAGDVFDKIYIDQKAN